jgi:hypothetical protein
MFHRTLDHAASLITLARLRVLDWFAGLTPDTPTDQAIRERGERLRAAFPKIDFRHIARIGGRDGQRHID